MTDEQKLKKVEKLIGYTYNDISLLKLALTHKSYAYEKGITSNNDYNERIEYLGDAILEHIISDMLYNDKKGQPKWYDKLIYTITRKDM